MSNLSSNLTRYFSKKNLLQVIFDLEPKKALIKSNGFFHYTSGVSYQAIDFTRDDNRDIFREIVFLW